MLKSPRRLSVRFSCTLSIALMLAGGITPGAVAGPPKDDKPTVSAALARNKYVEPTNWGKVSGRIYDAATGAPIDGAIVTVWQDGVFAEKGRTVGKTDAWGNFTCDAMLGRVSSNIDVKRLLTNLIAPVPGFGISQRTKRIDVSRLTVRVQKNGYTAYEGTVPCRTLDAEHFRVALEPVLLTTPASNEVSAVARGWGAVQIRTVTMEPAVLRPGMKGIIRAHVAWSAKQAPKDLKIRAVSNLIGNKELKLEKERDSNGDLIYSTTYEAGKKAPVIAQMVTVGIQQSPLDIAQNGSQKQLLLQVIDKDGDTDTATQRSDAYNSYVAGHTGEAVAAFKTLSNRSTPLAFDILSLGALATEAKDTSTAVYAYARFKEMTIKDKEIVKLAASYQYAKALLADGKPDQAFTEANGVINSIPQKERLQRLPAEIVIVAGEAAVQTGNLAKAIEMRNMLASWNVTSAQVAEITPFQNNLRLAESRQKVKAEPTNANAHAELGRVLLDQSRYAEALTELEAADKITPGLPAIRRDMKYALLNLEGGVPKVEKGLDEAIAEAQSAAEVPDSKDPKKSFKSKDFWAWYPLGMLRYAKYRALTDAGNNTEAIQQMQLCQVALVEALRCARSGANVKEGFGGGYIGYMEDRKVSTAGFAYPQADGVFQLRDSLRVLEIDPNNAHALLNLGNALLDLGYPDLAAQPIAKAAKVSGAPQSDLEYSQAMLALRMGDRDTGIKQLRNVVKENPRNGAAWNTLARLYTEDGDTAAASECLTAYARIYGTPAGSANGAQL